MKFILMVLFVFVSPKWLVAENPQAMPGLKLVGLILDQLKPVQDSILVIRDTTLGKTYTIRGRDYIPNSNFKLFQLGRSFILVTDGSQIYRINSIETVYSRNDSTSQPNSLDDLEADAIIARSNLVWERLEERAKKENLEIFQPRQIGSGDYMGKCDEGFCVGYEDVEEIVEDEHSSQEDDSIEDY